MIISKKGVFGFLFVVFFLFVVADNCLAFSEQRKFIGQNFDSATGLDYLNARYYDAKRGQFLNQDPLVQSSPEKFLADPQQLNDYSYARNNPINASDPSGLRVFYVPGTQLWGGRTNTIVDQALTHNINKAFPGQQITPVNWEGSDTTQARQQGTQNLAQIINNAVSSANACEPINIVDHSHGRNVVANYTRMPNAYQINNVVDIAGPALADNLYNEKKIDNHINVYSNLDPVQFFGGNQLSASGVSGAAIGSVLGPSEANVGYQLGRSLGWGEFGAAGREVTGAKNINATQQGSWLPWLTHGSLLTNPSVWDKISKEVKN